MCVFRSYCDKHAPASLKKNTDGKCCSERLTFTMKSLFFSIVPNTKLLCNWQEKVLQLDPLYTAMTPAHLTVQCVVLPRCCSQSLKVF